MKKSTTMTLFIVCSVLFTIWSGIRIAADYSFKNNCSGYLTRASNANSIELAEQNLTRAIEYLERNGLMEGQVSIFLRQPKNDITHWYANLKSAQEQLQSIDTENISNLEESNILMKLRETLTDEGSIVCLDGISVYPNNVGLFWLGIISGIGACVFGIWRAIEWM